MKRRVKRTIGWTLLILFAPIAIVAGIFAAIAETLNLLVMALDTHVLNKL